jgi:folate-dependent phosphoribosylglycinamide formyltransferase PurN
MMPNKPTLGDYENILSAYENPLITLHGWLRIVPEEIADQYEIFNGHPGLITLYPDLKGKDPQEKAFEANYKTIGSVIHKVTAGVDEGPVVMERAYQSEKLLPLDDIFRILHNISTDLWIKFFKERLW